MKLILVFLLIACSASPAAAKDPGGRRVFHDAIVGPGIPYVHESELDAGIENLIKQVVVCSEEDIEETFGNLVVALKYRPIFQEEVLAVLGEVVRGGKEEKRRIYAVLALARVEDIKAIDVIRPALTDKDLAVQRAALVALANIDYWGVSAPIIDSLEAREPEIRELAYSALKTIIGKDLGKDAAAWRKWARTNRRELKDVFGRRAPKNRFFPLEAFEKTYRAMDDLQNSESPAQRYKAIKTLSRMVKRYGQAFSGSEVETFFIAAARDSNRGVRKLALAGLGGIGGERVIDVLANALNDEEKDVRYAALRALGKTKDPRVVPYLIPLLEENDLSFCRSAIEALVPFKDERVIVPMIQALRHSRYLGIAGYVSRALQEMGEPAVKPLLAALEDEDWKIRLGAATVLGVMKDPRAVDPLLFFLGEKDRASREAARKALVEIGMPAVKPLIAALKDENINVRAEAVKALGEIKDPRAADPLIPLLGEEDARLRADVIDALGKIGSPSAVRHLIVALKDDKHYRNRARAANALGELKDPKALRPLVDAMLNDGAIQQASAKAAAAIDSDKALELLKKEIEKGASANAVRNAFLSLRYFGESGADTVLGYLAHQDASVRKEAAQTLLYMLQKHGSLLADYSVAEAVIGFFKGGNAAALPASTQLDLLIKVGTPEAYTYLSHVFKASGGEFHSGWQSKFGGRKMKKEALQPLVAALSDKDVEVRRGAAAALGWLRNPDALAALQDALKDTDPRVRHNAVASLGLMFKVTDSEGIADTLVAVFADSAEDKNVRQVAAGYLGRMKIQDVLDRVIGVLKDKSEPVEIRAAAAQLLQRSGDPRAKQVLADIRADTSEDERLLKAAAEPTGLAAILMQEWMGRSR